MSVTLTTLRTRVRERADMVSSSFVSDAATGLDAWINEGVQILHGKLVEALGDEYVASTSSISLVASTSSYALPSDFFKMYGVDLPVGGRTRTLKPYSRAGRNSLSAVNPSWLTFPQYRLSGANIVFLPTPTAAATATLYYAPSATVLVNASDAVSVPNGWETYIVLYAAIQALLKEESDVKGLREELGRIEAEILRLRDDRDAGFPRSAVDLDEVNLDWRW